MIGLWEDEEGGFQIYHHKDRRRILDASMGTCELQRGPRYTGQLSKR